MRTLRRNQTKLYYSLYNGKTPVYQQDDEGNKYETGDFEYTYAAPIEFQGNIATSGNGDAYMAEYGLDLSDYNATLVVGKDVLPLVEGSLIWQNTPPTVDDRGYAVKESADYTVIKVSKGLDSDKFVLKKLV